MTWRAMIWQAFVEGSSFEVFPSGTTRQKLIRTSQGGIQLKKRDSFYHNVLQDVSWCISCLPPPSCRTRYPRTTSPTAATEWQLAQETGV